MKKTTKKPGMPFADSAIAKYIDKKIDEPKGVKTQREIAAEDRLRQAQYDLHVQAR